MKQPPLPQIAVDEDDFAIDGKTRDSAWLHHCFGPHVPDCYKGSVEDLSAERLPFLIDSLEKLLYAAGA